MNVFKAILFSLGIFVNVAAQAPDAGTTAFPFVNIEYDARSLGMGGASVGMPDDIYGILSNPASIGYIEGMQAMAGYRPILLGVWGLPAAVGANLGPTGVYAISAVTLTSGNVNAEGIGPDGSPVNLNQTWMCNYLAGGISWAKVVLSDLSTGVTVKGLYNYIGDGAEYWSADAFAVDAGVQYRKIHDRLVIGLAVRNLGVMQSGYENNDLKYPLPFTLAAGISYVPMDLSNIRFACDITSTKGELINFNPGIEIDVYKKILALRAGYLLSQDDIGQGFSLLQGTQSSDYVKTNMGTLCLGAGLNAPIDKVNVRIDVAMQFLSDVSTPSIALSALLGN